jgi:hypothetical protein
MRSGDTFVMAVAGRSAKPHLWFVLTDPDPETGKVVIVSLSTLREGKDQTVILRRGDHPFITHESVIVYWDAQCVCADELRQASRNGLVKPHEPCADWLLKHIQDGLLASPFTSPKMAAYCRRRWGR